MEPTPASARIAPWILVGLVLAWWIAVKTIHLFHAEYTSDLFTHYQLSTSWLRGKPLFWENCFGHQERIHNYFLSPLMAVFTYPLGVWGIVAVHGLALAGATAAFLRRAAEDGAARSRWLLFGFLGVLWLGPLSFYVWDDPYYGWHVELLYPALALLHGLALRSAHRPAVLATAALLALAKEDGAVLGLCVGLAHLAAAGTEPQADVRLLLRRAAVTVAIWGAVLVAGLAWLQVESEGYSPLSAGIAIALRADPTELSRYLAAAVGWQLFLALAAAPLLLALLAWRTVAALLLISIPLIVTNVVSGLWYFPDLANGPSWSPRVGMLWGYWCSCLALAVLAPRSSADGARVEGPRLLVPLALSLGVQLVALRAAPEPYRVLERGLSRPLARLTGALDDPRLELLNAIGERLPAGYPVAPPSAYFAPFRRQEIFWWDHPHDRGRPELYVCDGACDVRFPGFDWSDKSRFRLGGFEFVATAETERMIREQFARSPLADGDRDPRR